MQTLNPQDCEQVTGALARPTTLMMGEEGSAITTLALGEEGSVVTTLALGEEGGGQKAAASTATTSAFGSY